MKQRIKKKLWTRRYQCSQFSKGISDVHSIRVRNISFHTASVDVLSKTEELNFELHCVVNFATVYSKRKWEELNTTRTIMQPWEILHKYILHL